MGEGSQGQGGQGGVRVGGWEVGREVRLQGKGERSRGKYCKHRKCEASLTVIVVKHLGLQGKSQRV